ncbi:MAG: EAL domain-containing protein [Acidimicrobiia bacterium]|nr:EAL domain-containing protein [Acidimicrobiia bacterium]
MKQYLRSILGVALITATLAGASIAFASSDGAQAVAEDAAVQVRVQELLSAVDFTRAVLSEGLVFGVAYQNGDLSKASFEAALADAEASLSEVEARAQSTTSLLGADSEIASSIDQYLVAASTLVLTLEEERFDEARRTPLLTFLTAYEEATLDLTTERDRRESHIAAVRQGVAGVADASRFVVAFFVPAAVLLGALAFAGRRQRRLRLETEFAQDERLRVGKDQFLTAIAQELRTPLTAVVGFAETLRDRDRLLNPEEREELVGIVAEEATATAAIVEDLLVFARANIGDLAIRAEAVTVRELIDKIASSWAHVEHGRLKVTGNGAAWVDPLRLGQVMRILLSNALKHGGKAVEVRIHFDPTAVRIEVADNGAGIPEDLRPRIFEPYQHGVGYEGNPASIGLGLTVAQSLVRLMDGDLAYSYLNGESVFQVTLPAALSQAPPAHDQAKVVEPSRHLSAAQVLAAIDASGFEIAYQPIIDVQHSDGHRVVGLEASVLFPKGPPEDWLTAVAAGLPADVELELIRAAVAGFTDAPPMVFLAVKASLETLLSPELLDALDGVTPAKIVLVLSEDSVVDNYQGTLAHLDRLAAKGYRLAVDDLARGRIDLWHLVRLRPAIVKFDVSLVRDLDIDPGSRALVNALKWLGDVLKCKVVADGIERPEELEAVRHLGVHYGQGGLLARPGTLEEHLRVDVTV